MVSIVIFSVLPSDTSSFLSRDSYDIVIWLTLPCDIFIAKNIIAITTTVHRPIADIIKPFFITTLPRIIFMVIRTRGIGKA